MAKELTEKQQKFLDVLFDEANGDVTQASYLQAMHLPVLRQTSSEASRMRF
tara:strand:+ start:731 stop:883 length:153 start_codon:yes stop_codon:yes gene_type:complete